MSTGRLHILNTRPAHQAAELTAVLRAAGLMVSELPLLEIVVRDLSAAEQRLLMDMDRYDGVFFISANAARFGLDAAAGFWPQWPWQLRTYAVGHATAELLAAAGLDVEIPAERADSEGLLQLPALQNVAGKRFLLMRGVGGRELLRRGLEARGAQVDVLELYHRELPAAARAQWQSLTPAPDIVLLTSPDALRHWQEVAAEQAVLPRWLVVSERMALMGRTAGARVVQAQGADKLSLLHALQEDCGAH
ncbi:MAG: uroporphyrinogen-III synthase [Moraxellaceae bacterium]